MALRNHLILALLLPSLATGCVLPTAKKVPGQTSGAEGTVRGGLKPATRPGATPAPTVGNRLNPPTGSGLVSNNGAGVISNNGAGVIGNNAASLSGIVRAPASLLSNNGAGYRILGGRFRVMGAVAEGPVAKATVKLLDAEGKAIAGADGKVLTAVTDDQGRYEFKGILPANNLLVVVDLGDKGALKAIAPKGGGEARKANMDLISTLTTSYILDQYVKGQTDRQKTLDKLPPNVEAETRAKAASAFETTNTTVPAKLTDADVVMTVNGLRQRDTAFNEQMETVKRLLIAAGQSDLGSGRLGTEVNLSSVSGLVIAADNTLYINAPYDRRVWKLDANGRLVTAAGKGSAGTESLTGKMGPDALLTTLRSVSLDGAGRALIFEDDLSMELDSAPYGARLSWLGTDGKLTEISRAFGWGGFAVPGTGDEAIVVSWLAADEDEGNAQIVSVKPGQAPQVKKVLTDAQSNLISNAEAAGVDAQGGILFTTYEDGPDDELFSVLYRLDAATGAMTKVMALPDDISYALDSRGNLFKLTATGALEVRKADGTNLTLATSAQVPTALKDGWLDAGALATDGSAYVAFGGKVYKVTGGNFTRVIGTDATAPVSGKAGDLSIAAPGGVGVFGATFFVSDTENHRVLRIGADQQVSTFAGNGQEGAYEEDGTSPDGDGGQATAAKVGNPGILHADAAGNLYIAEYYRIRKVATDGRISTVFKVDPDDEATFSDFVVAPDGTLYLTTELSEEDPDDPDIWLTTAKILKLAPGATQTTTVTQDVGESAGFVLAVDKSGVLHYAAAVGDDSGKLVKWTPQGPQVLKTDARFMPMDLGAGSMAIDGQGRVYTATGNKVQRFDPVSGAFKVIAGPGGTHFNGAGVDQSLDEVGYPAFDAEGNLYLADSGHRQIKRIPAGQL